MRRLVSPWPAAWSRERRSSADMIAACVGMLVLLWALGRFLSFAPDPIGPEAKSFSDGAIVTVELTLVAGVAGLVLGLLAALGKIAKLWPVRALADGYVWVVRGTPLLVQVMFCYQALPSLIPGFRVSEFTTACIALSLNVGAYNAEAIRAGLLAVPKGQLEAARSLGLSRWYTFIDVTAPQAFKISLPPLVNNIVALLKDSSLAYTIGVAELANAGAALSAATFRPTPSLIATALIYLALTTVLTHFSGAVERRFDIEDKLS